ncbi:hypothetical protein VPH35_011365 [Triticum aestivum]
MESKRVNIVDCLTDDILVEILSRVPPKSFCRFKCVCKAWLAFSSDPLYRRKLPKTSTGLLYKPQYGSAIQLVGMSPNDEEIDGAFTFIPQYEQLELVDYCNGLVLCRYKSRYTSAETCRFIVCNPATREWRTLPILNTPYGPNVSPYTAFLAFDPSWSGKFYVFNFQEKLKNNLPLVIYKLEVFSSDLCEWLVDDAWSGNHRIMVNKPHNFIGGVFHVHSNTSEILVVKGLSSGIMPYHYTIKLPGDCWNGCFSQSMGLLQCAFPEEGGSTIAVFTLDDYRPCKWSLKHRFCMGDAFGRDNFLPNRDYLSWLCFYRIVALDLERGVLFLVDKESNKLFSYKTSTGQLSEIKDGRLGWTWECFYYVACYSKLPVLSRLCDVIE